jgi:hypothetical protein
LLIALPESAELSNVFLACVLMLFLAAHGCGTRELGGNSQGEGVIKGQPDSTASDSVFHLDLARPTITQAIDPRKGRSERAKFVEVEVAAVTNPERHPMTFELRYQSRGEGTIYLGSFSLFPADNPGTFIVATQGKLRNEGAMVLSLVRPPGSSSGDSIRVGVKKLRFLFAPEN